MPYKSIDELPDNLRAVPKHAKEIYMAAYNSAYDGTCKDSGERKESCCAAIAWSAVGKKYEKKDDKWVEKKGGETKSVIHSITTEKPRVDNGTWIPFLKPGQLAEDNAGKRYRITKEAIESGYKSYLGGSININHSDKISGKISDVKYDGNFAYAKLDGLDNEAIDVINSAAYRGVSQQSFNLKSNPVEGDENMIDVLELKGDGLAIALYPKQPGCPIKDGCGVPIASTTSSLPGYAWDSVNTTPITSTGIDTKVNAEYSEDQIKDMLAYIQGHPDKINPEIKSIMSTILNGDNHGKNGINEIKIPSEIPIKWNAKLNKWVFP